MSPVTLLSSLADPLVKVPILVFAAYINYASWNFPNAPSAANRKRRETADPITRILTLTALSVKLTLVRDIQQTLLRVHHSDKP